ncbi:MAG TPA: hypothetical protein VGT61_06500 [Thermomicrobiales bacterium]|jgi:hypothetical protein|nr:hypothetical protein [Thermomicrobiales bacterium]
MTQSPGWLRPDQIASAETVVARFRREHLPAGLAALHGRGMGHTARVLDPERGPVDDQFRRAGIAADLGFGELAPDDVFILVSATGRSAAVGDLLLDNRARDVRVYQPASVSGADDVVIPAGDDTEGLPAT